MKLSRLASLTLLGAMSLSIFGCNLTGGIDDPKDREDLVEKAKSQMDQGMCSDAIKTLNNIENKNDAVYNTLGWAQLCQAGATINRVGATLFSYSSTASNFYVVGQLANQLLPYSEEKRQAVESAISTFRKMTETTKDRAIGIALADIVKAAVLIEKASPDGVIVLRSHISGNACLNSACATGTGCTSAGSGTFGDSDASAVMTAINDAANVLGSDSSFGSAKDLATQLSALTGGAVLANASRCAIYNNMLGQ